MLWFPIGIALWILFLLVCWVALDASLHTSFPASDRADHADWHQRVTLSTKRSRAKITR